MRTDDECRGSGTGSSVAPVLAGGPVLLDGESVGFRGASGRGRAARAGSRSRVRPSAQRRARIRLSGCSRRQAAGIGRARLKDRFQVAEKFDHEFGELGGVLARGGQHFVDLGGVATIWRMIGSASVGVSLISFSKIRSRRGSSSAPTMVEQSGRCRRVGRAFGARARSSSLAVPSASWVDIWPGSWTPLLPTHFVASSRAPVCGSALVKVANRSPKGIRRRVGLLSEWRGRPSRARGRRAGLSIRSGNVRNRNRSRRDPDSIDPEIRLGRPTTRSVRRDRWWTSGGALFTR
ncbi:hypothetical protein FB390_4969 [Nocardia bhagyanarayanae]|uniref:Uncharacterized protein n=1 Tax=Nocardia bhagyanarayanae TaxID=1215925 RepID=A0A543FHA2_9NOCA|nr:hypothetical protein FB390_4969 [Nocardia bhagyanarayanae]